MAKPIKETPFLSGKDARVFIEKNKEVKRISEKERHEITQNYEALISISEFDI